MMYYMFKLYKLTEREFEMKIGDRIKELRLSQNLTQEQFGKLFGIVKSTVSLYENNRSVPDDEIKTAICRYFHVSMDYLMGIDSGYLVGDELEDIIRSISIELQQPYEKLLDIFLNKKNINELNISNLKYFFMAHLNLLDNLTYVKKPIETSKAMIHVLGEVPAGVPIEAVEFIVDEIELPQNLASDSYEYFGLLVSGDSMYPEYMDGDIIVVRKQNTADSGDDVVAYVNGYNATLKRLIKSEKGLTLRALNPAYESKFYSNQEIIDLPIKIAGIVVEQRRNRR